MKLSVIALVLNVILATAGQAAVVPVSMTNFAFTPATVFVGVGDTVQWTNNSSLRHSSTSGVANTWDSIWDSGILDPTASYSFQFTAVDSYPYFCKIHLGMNGLVIVSATGMEEGGRTMPVPELAVSASPNPFASATSIWLESGQVRKLEVLDLTGRVVRTLAADSRLAAWDGRNGRGQAVPAGVYLVRAMKDGLSSYTLLVKTE